MLDLRRPGASIEDKPALGRVIFEDEEAHGLGWLLCCGQHRLASARGVLNQDATRARSRRNGLSMSRCNPYAVAAAPTTNPASVTSQTIVGGHPAP